MYCECGQGKVIGLQPDSDYWVVVYVFNTAGKSNPSERYLVSTYEWREYYKPRHEKTNVLVSDRVRHKPGCTATEDG